MKRLLWTAAGSIVGWFVWTKVQEEREERSIWAEVTDSFGETPDGRVPTHS
ncbi:MAG: DLW-39 family protein [Actinomycetota bacterium]